MNPFLTEWWLYSYEVSFLYCCDCWEIIVSIRIILHTDKIV